MTPLAIGYWFGYVVSAALAAVIVTVRERDNRSITLFDVLTGLVVGPMVAFAWPLFFAILVISLTEKVVVWRKR